MTNLESRPLRLIGPYTDGETPRTVYVEFDDDVLDLSGFSLNGVGVEIDDVAGVFGGTVTWHDASLGVAKLELSADELTLPTDTSQSWCELQIWASDGTNAIATVVIAYWLNAAVGTKPATSP